MRLRMVSWNVDSRPTGLLDAKVELLRQIRPDLAVLQEINRSVYRGLMPHTFAHHRIDRQSRMFSWGALSTDLCTPRGSEHRLGCAVLGAPTTALLGAEVLDRVPFAVPEPVRLGFLWRTVAARVALSTGMSLTVGSFHARRTPTSQAIALQRAFHSGIASWLAEVRGPVIFGMSAGAPALDMPEVQHSVSWSVPDSGAGADPLLGPDADHDLDDVLRAYLHHHPEELERIRAVRPGGPLAISHHVSAQPVRHDHLWATRDLKVLDVQYLYDEAVAAGSDHALVLTDFEA